MFREYVECLWGTGRRRVEDLTQQEVARATALWCQFRPVDAAVAVQHDVHVQERVAHRLADYFHAIASQDLKHAQTCERGLSSMLTNVARQECEAYIRSTFQTNAYLERFCAEHAA